MMSDLRFICPDNNISKEDRKHMLIDQVSRWVDSQPLEEMVGLFGKSMPKTVSLEEKVAWLNDFAADEWDYRKKQSNGGERWTVVEDEAVLKNGDKILECVTELGLVGIEQPICSPDYILPLGGANYSNLARPQLARQVVDECSLKGKSIVALSGKRPISEAELPAIGEYAPSAKTEYDAMCTGLEKSFDLEGSDYSEKNDTNENINLESSIRKYTNMYMENGIYSLAAPSSEPLKRRANSRDTFEWFLKQFEIKPGEKLLLVTTAIYVPFQLLRFIDLAIEEGFCVDCIGVPRNGNKQNAFNQYTNYCQETKSVINAIKSLTDQWL